MWRVCSRCCPCEKTAAQQAQAARTWQQEIFDALFCSFNAAGGGFSRSLKATVQAEVTSTAHVGLCGSVHVLNGAQDITCNDISLEIVFIMASHDGVVGGGEGSASNASPNDGESIDFSGVEKVCCTRVVLLILLLAFVALASDVLVMVVTCLGPQKRNSRAAGAWALADIIGRSRYKGLDPHYPSVGLASGCELPCVEPRAAIRKSLTQEPRAT
ncbi:hypothetical protein GOP47_0000594 [Adiantum capillus-veneris]|uniref:Uncharacterized protein n=1 Tax=Adiantum capillus-veneris TaxID=13818 RepID=A0A9D4VE88_ADICA|nr:hypothetical protein GOP47_0000594 [Adiantum capillus-veneris]